MSILVLIVAILFLIIYIKFYITPNPNIQLIQPTLGQVTQSHLFEKLPLVIAERVVDINDLLTTLFKYMYISKTISDANNTKWLQNRHRYLVVQATSNSIIKIVHPHKVINISKEQYIDAVAIKLEKYQVLIIPYKWWYRIEGTCKILKLHDLASLFLNI